MGRGGQGVSRGLWCRGDGGERTVWCIYGWWMRRGRISLRERCTRKSCRMRVAIGVRVFLKAQIRRWVW